MATLLPQAPGGNTARQSPSASTTAEISQISQKLAPWYLHSLKSLCDDFFFFARSTCYAHATAERFSRNRRKVLPYIRGRADDYWCSQYLSLRAYDACSTPLAPSFTSTAANPIIS